MRHPKDCLLWRSRSREEVPTESQPSGGRGEGEVWEPRRRGGSGGVGGVDSLALGGKAQ